MCRLFETIKISGGEPVNLSLHEERMNRTRKELLGINEPVQLAGLINAPPDSINETFRCRIIYGVSIGNVEYTKYLPAVTRTLKTIDAGNLNYEYKYLDRSGLTSLINKNVADDVLIVRNGCITDTSYANIVFTDGKNWITPDTPLLRGTMREFLLNRGIIQTGRITIERISDFTHFRLINAMLGFEGQLITVKNIF